MPTLIGLHSDRVEYLQPGSYIMPIVEVRLKLNRAKIKSFHNFHGQNIEAWILQIQNDLIFG